MSGGSKGGASPSSLVVPVTTVVKGLALTTLLVVKQGILVVVACRACRILRANGVRGLVGALMRALRTSIPGVDSMVEAMLTKQVRKAVASRTGGARRRQAEEGEEEGTEGPPSLSSSSVRRRAVIRLPEKGLLRHQVLDQLNAFKSEAITNGCKGVSIEGPLTEHFKTLVTVFQSLEPESGAGIDHDSMIRAAFSAFMHNHAAAMDPTYFPALRRFEMEVVGMTAALLHGNGHGDGDDDDDGEEEVVGCLTSGGRESILMAVKTYRDYARKYRPHITSPEMLLPVTAHPAFHKAAHYFGVKAVLLPVGPDARVELESVGGAVTPNTILIVASAPQHPHGVVDPIMALSELAEEHDLPLHVDASMGGFMLPWLERLGESIPLWDFRCPGVTSVSLDLHKYAYTLKGAGVLLYRSTDVRQCQYFAYVDWPGGLFGSTGLAPRSGGSIAAAWAAMVSLGEEGYMELARATADATRRMKEGVRRMEGLGLVAESEMTSLAICSRDEELDILSVGDNMERRGWQLERQQSPASLHLSVMPQHQALVDQFLTHLRASVKESLFPPRGGKPHQPTATMYSMLARLPDRTLVSDFIVKFIDETYRLQPSGGSSLGGSSGSSNGGKAARPFLMRHHSSKDLQLMEGLKEEEEGEEEEEEQQQGGGRGKEGPVVAAAGGGGGGGGGERTGRGETAEFVLSTQ